MFYYLIDPETGDFWAGNFREPTKDPHSKSGRWGPHRSPDFKSAKLLESKLKACHMARKWGFHAYRIDGVRVQPPAEPEQE